ncbi:hypothetical protein GCM10009753_21940 [Streptantibioticus ferralitis]
MLGDVRRRARGAQGVPAAGGLCAAPAESATAGGYATAGDKECVDGWPSAVTAVWPRRVRSQCRATRFLPCGAMETWVDHGWDGGLRRPFSQVSAAPGLLPPCDELEASAR